MLNGLGHCISLPSVMSYDTALAQINVDTSVVISRGFVENKFVNLVFGNIDFGEAVKNQTHVTNGIITQVISGDDVRTPERTINIKKMQRTLKAPPTDMVPYALGVKKTPAFQEVQVNVEHHADITTRTASVLDTAYIAIKSVHTYYGDQCPLPGWTGFNTILVEVHEIPKESRVGYLPIINANPTEYPTIYAILKRSVSIVDKLKLKYAVVVFDEGLYSKVQQVRGKEQTFYDKLVCALESSM